MNGTRFPDKRAPAPAQVPVYIWAPEEEGQFQPGRCSRWWLHNSLEALEADLKALGSRIVYRSAPESRTALLQVVQETGATVRHRRPDPRRASPYSPHPVGQESQGTADGCVL